MTLVLLITAYGRTAAAEVRECKTPKGQRCVCAANSAKKCANIAKAVCLNGKTVETPPGQLLSAHENNVELFRLCRTEGGMKEIVSNMPLLDTFHNTNEPKQTTAASE